jgi:hypothetical protein
MTVVAILAILVAICALTVAVGVSLGRQGDREDIHLWRADTDEALHNLDERLKKVEPDRGDDGSG